MVLMWALIGPENLTIQSKRVMLFRAKSVVILGLRKLLRIIR